jgi:acetylglutamate kinase
MHSGMVPKLRGVVTALRAGVRRAHILDGRRRHALLLELFTDRGVGTMIGPEEETRGGAPVDGPGDGGRT